MALAYRIGEQARRQLRARGEAHDGHIVVMLDERRVARFVRLHDGGKLQPGEILLRYRLRGDSMKFATNAFFFEEGQAKRYEAARYGEFRVAPDGELLLQALRGADGERL